MRCSACGVENRQAAKFCGGCGKPLLLACAECGSGISPTNKFCDNCGALAPTPTDRPNAGLSVAAGHPVAAPVAPAAPEMAANRRQMSLLSCDLVDSSLLARGLDPEDLRYAINNFHQISKDIIQEYEGYYAQYMGDGFMAYFSYPIAHEDDAYRAVLAGLRIIEAVRQFNIDLKKKHNIELHLRAGVNTGQVVVDEFVVGEPPNIASRVQAAGAPDTVVITETTKRLLPSGAFTFEDLGVQDLKNVGAIHLFRVLERSGQRNLAGETPVTRPLIGRQKQLDLLLDHWDLVKDGNGQAVIVTGEAGIGKSKLLQGFQAQFGVDAHIILSLHGSPFHRNTMLYPVIENIQLAAKLLPQDADDERLEKLTAFLQPFNNSERMLPFLGRLLSLPGLPSLRQVPAQRILQQTLDVLIEIVLQHANRGPTLLIFEDIHWFDPTTMTLIESLIPLIGKEPVFLLLTTRSSFTSQLQEKYYFTQIALSRLRSNEAEDLIQAITGDRTLPERVHAEIVAKANGMPLYLEELTKMVLETEPAELSKNQEGAIGGSDFVIPVTLRDPLTSRIDRVKGRRVLQLAATLGRTFSYDLLLGISSMDGDALSKELRHLVAAELLYQKGTVLQEAVFEFKHALIRDAAYALLTKAERETYHKKVARLIEKRFSETARAHPEVIAYHYTQARSYEKAAHYWYEAGRQSAARSAHNEAVDHLKQGLKQIPHINDPVLRTKSELLLQTSLGNSLRAIEGWSADRVGLAYTRALQLCKESGFDEHTLPAVFGLWTWNFVHGALDESQALAEHLLNAAEQATDSFYKVLGHEAQGFTLFARGRFSEAHQELKCSISLCEDSKAAAYLQLSAQDPRVHVRLYNGMALHFLGYSGQALQMCAEARAYGDTTHHPFSKAMARTITLRVHQLRGEAAAVASQADEAIALCEEHEFAHYLALSLVLRGWASATQGEFEKGIAELQEGLEKIRATAAFLFEPYSLSLMADACIQTGRYKQALEFLEQAKANRDDELSTEHFYSSEIYRLLGEAHFRSGEELGQAERYLLKALDVAEKQGSKTLELRALLSLCDLAEHGESASKYRARLGEVYASFTEGFETPDLVKAKTRLGGV
jgi:class 3 adenylate cyclase/tetratricopeptide (TPR) repeat protein